MNTDNLGLFDFHLRSLLTNKVNEGHLNISDVLIQNFILNFQEVDGELRYFIQDTLLDELDDSTLKEIEALWLKGL